MSFSTRCAAAVLDVADHADVCSRSDQPQKTVCVSGGFFNPTKILCRLHFSLRATSRPFHVATVTLKSAFKCQQCRQGNRMTCCPSRGIPVFSYWEWLGSSSLASFSDSFLIKRFFPSQLPLNEQLSRIKRLILIE